MKTTGEIGAVKLVSMVSYKGGERIYDAFAEDVP